MSEFKSWDELSVNEKMHCEYYDFYKEVHGIRPRWIYGDGGVPLYSEQEMDEMLDRLAEESKLVFAEEAQAEQRAIAKFEQRVLDTIKAGARDRATAIRWIFEAEGHGYEDPDYICFCLGLPYGYFKEAA